MTDLTDRHVIVVGAAIGGAAAALLLARAGARITLLERVAEPAAVGAGIALQPNGLAVLYGLGLRDALQRTGCRATFFGVRDAAGRVLTSGLVPAGGHGLDHILIIRRSHLLAALHEAVRAQPGLDLRLGTEVVRATTAGEVTVRGPAGEVSLRGDLVIGADGVHSVIRRSGSFGDRERRTGVSYVRALTPHSLPAVPAGETWSPLGIFGHFPVEDGTYFYTSAAAPDVRRALDRRSLPTFQAAWEAVYPPAGPLIAALGGFDDLLINEVIRVDCDRLADGRLVLLGDAAHAMAPNLGQGANSALVDAAILIEELSRRPDLHAALAVYDAQRRRAVRRVQDLAGRLTTLADWRHPVARALRDRAVILFGRLAGDPRRLAKITYQEEPARLLELIETLAPPPSHSAAQDTPAAGSGRGKPLPD